MGGRDSVGWNASSSCNQIVCLSVNPVRTQFPDRKIGIGYFVKIEKPCILSEQVQRRNELVTKTMTKCLLVRPFCGSASWNNTHRYEVRHIRYITPQLCWLESKNCEFYHERQRRACASFVLQLCLSGCLFGLNHHTIHKITKMNKERGQALLDGCFLFCKWAEGEDLEVSQSP